MTHSLGLEVMYAICRFYLFQQNTRKRWASSPPGESASPLFDPIWKQKLGSIGCHSTHTLPDPKNDITNSSSELRTTTMTVCKFWTRTQPTVPLSLAHSSANHSGSGCEAFIFMTKRRTALSGNWWQIRGMCMNRTQLSSPGCALRPRTGVAASSGIHETPKPTEEIWPRLIASTSTRHKTQKKNI